MRFLNKIAGKIHIAVLICGTAMFFSCREKIDFIDPQQINDQPTQLVYDFVTTYTDSAKLKLRLEAPIMKYYGRVQEPYSDFDEGLKVYFYNDSTSDAPSASLTSKFARYYESKKLWEVRDSVVATNEGGEVLETELLYWDEDKALIYTDKFVKIIQQEQIIMGTNFESDTKFSKWVIKNVSGTITLHDE